MILTNSTSSASSMQLEETSTIDSLTLSKILKSKSILWLRNRFESSSLLLSNESTSPFICVQRKSLNENGEKWIGVHGSKWREFPMFLFDEFLPC